MTAFQKAVNIWPAFGVPGEVYLAGPTRSAPFIINSSGTPNKIGNVYTQVSGADSEGAQAGTAQVGGAGVFAGILGDPKLYASFGTTADGPLAPSFTIPDQSIGQLFTMCEICVTLPGPANPGDLVTFDPLTGDLNSIAPLTTFQGAISTTTLTVTGPMVGRLQIGSLISGAGVTPGTYITALGTGLGGLGTYTINNSQTVTPAEAMTAPNTPEPAFSGTASLATDGTLTVASVVSGQVAIGSRIVGVGINAVVTGFGTGAGGTGTYTTNQTGSVVTTEAITSPGNTLIPRAVVDRWTIAGTGGLAVIKLTD